MTSLPTVSVIVPVRNGGKLLERCLRSVLGQNYPRDCFEILVVDNGSTDGSADVARALGVFPLFESRPGAGLARNRGIGEATGDIIAFTDADCTLPPAWIAALVGALREADAVMARIDPFPGGNRFARARATLHGLYLADCRRLDRENRLDRLDTANAAAWRRVLDQVGGFHPEIFPGEDRELGARIAERGGRVKFAEDPIVLHHYEQGILSSMRKAEGRGRMWVKLPGLLSADTLKRRFADITKLLATAATLASLQGRRRLRRRFWMHLAAAAVRPGFDNCLHHFREAERLATLIGIVRGFDGQSRVQTKR